MLKPGLALLRTVTILGFLLCAISSVAQQTNDAASAVQASSQGLDPAAYVAELDRCSDAVKHPEQISQLRASLPTSWSVRVGESHMQVSTAWLSTLLQCVQDNPEHSKAAVTEIQTRLASLRAAASELAAAPKDNASDTRARLNGIFERQEFRQAKGPNPFQLAIRHAVRWLAEKIIRLLSGVHVGRKNGNIFAWIVITIVFVLLGAWVYRRLSRATVASNFKAEGKALPSDTRQWISDALSAAERGDFREAIHCGYWAAVASLEDHRLLERDRARTPRESLRLLGSHPAHQEMLGDLTCHFELIWYGYRPASHEDWSGARTLLEKMGCLKASTAATANS